MTRMQKPIDFHKTLIYGQLKTLQEAKLSLFPRSDCAKFKKTLKVDTRIEMCAGHINNPLFKRTLSFDLSAF